MSTHSQSPTGSPSVNAVHDFISDMWPTLTQAEALIRLSQLVEDMARVRDAGITPARPVSAEPVDADHTSVHPVPPEPVVSEHVFQVEIYRIQKIIFLELYH